MRIDLVVCPPWDVAFPSIGMPYVVAALRRAGHEVVSRDVNLEAWAALREVAAPAWQAFEWWEEAQWGEPLAGLIEPLLASLVDDLAASDASVVGFGFMGTNHFPTQWVARHLRARRPTVRLLGGGHGMSEPVARALVDSGDLDAAVVGEGEHAAVEWLARLGDAATRTNWEPVPGVVHRDPDGRVQFGGVRAPVPLDTFPDPDFTDVKFDDYDYVAFYDLDGSLPILGSRGCTFRCTFCSEATSFGRYRFRRAGDIVREMREHAERYGRRKYLFMDSLVNGRHGELEAMVNQLVEADVGVQWGGQARLDARLTDDLLARMARSGCRFLIFGFESGSQRVLDAMQKHVDVETAIRVIHDAHRHGIQIHLNVIVGYPNERWRDFGETLRVLYRVRRAVGGVSAFRLRMHTGAPLFRNADKHDLVLGETAPKLDESRWKLSDDWRTKDGHNTPEVRLQRYRILLRFLEASRIRSLSDSIDLASMVG